MHVNFKSNIDAKFHMDANDLAIDISYPPPPKKNRKSNQQD